MRILKSEHFRFEEARKDTHESRLSGNRATVSMSYAVLHGYHPLLATASTRRRVTLVSLRRISRRYPTIICSGYILYLLLSLFICLIKIAFPTYSRL